MNIRQVAINDSEVLWQWRNHVTTRQMSLRADEVSFEEHTIWFNSVVNDPTKLILIGERNEHNLENTGGRTESRFAMMRLDFLKSESTSKYDKAIVSINLNPDYRGQSLAVPFLQQSFNWFTRIHSKLPIQLANEISVLAQIKAENIASIKCFESLDFVCDQLKSDEELLHYFLELKLT